VSGSSNGLRAQLALVGLVAIVTGAALAAPVGVLIVGDGARRVTVPLGDGERLRYSYLQSVYQAPVIEEQERRGNGFHVFRVRSPSRQAVEYFRWDGPVRRDGDSYVQDAPANEVPELVIRITAANVQRLEAAQWSIDLPARFGDEALVYIRAADVPRAFAFFGIGR
jgi:hypothetical protein